MKEGRWGDRKVEVGSQCLEGLIRIVLDNPLIALVCGHYSISILILDTLFLPNAFGPATLGLDQQFSIPSAY